MVRKRRRLVGRVVRDKEVGTGRSSVVIGKFLVDWNNR